MRLRNIPSLLLAALFFCGDSFAAEVPRQDAAVLKKKWERELEECHNGADALLGQLIARMSVQPGAKDVPPEQEIAWLESYLVCQGLATGDVKACQRLKDAPGEIYLTCRERQIENQMAWRIFHGLDAAAACRIRMAMVSPPLKETDWDQYCGILIKVIKTGQTAQFCDELGKRGVIKGADLRGCPAHHAYLLGMPDQCEKADSRCRAEAGLIQALRSKDPAYCSASPLCGALSRHDVAACSVYLAYLKKSGEQRCAQAEAQLRKLRGQDGTAEAEEKHRLEDRQRREKKIAVEAEEKRRIEGQQKLEKEAAREQAVQKAAAARRLKAAKMKREQLQEGQPMETGLGDVEKRAREVESGNERRGK